LPHFDIGRSYNLISSKKPHDQGERGSDVHHRDGHDDTTFLLANLMTGGAGGAPPVSTADFAPPFTRMAEGRCHVSEFFFSGAASRAMEAACIANISTAGGRHFVAQGSHLAHRSHFVHRWTIVTISL